MYKYNTPKSIYKYVYSVLRASDRPANLFASAYGYMTAPERARQAIDMAVLLGVINGNTARRLFSYFKL